MSGFSAKSFYKCKRSARLSACSRNATNSDTVSSTHSRQRKTRVDEDFLYYMHMPKRKKSKVDVPEVDKAVHQTVDVPESSDVVLPDDSVVLEYNAVPQTVNVPESSDVVLPNDNVVLEDNAVRQTVDVPESSDVVLMQDNNANVVSKCHVFGCNEKVFLACPTCLEFLCYEHKDSECVEHASTYVVLDGVICTDGYVTVVTETGEFQVPVESPDCSVGSASFAGNENNTDHGLNAGVKHKTNTRKKKKSPHPVSYTHLTLPTNREV